MSIKPKVFYPLLAGATVIGLYFLAAIVPPRMAKTKSDQFAKSIQHVRYTVIPNKKPTYDKLFTITADFYVSSDMTANPVPFEPFMGNIPWLGGPSLKVDIDGEYGVVLLRQYPKFKFVVWPEGEPARPAQSAAQNKAKVLYQAGLYKYRYAVGLRSQSPSFNNEDCYGGFHLPDAYVLASRLLQQKAELSKRDQVYHLTSPVEVSLHFKANTNEYFHFDEKYLGDYKVFHSGIDLKLDDVARLIKRAGDSEPRLVCD